MRRIHPDRALTENNLKQAYFPEGAIVMPNRRGTAPGCIVEAEGKAVAVLPGPPRELKDMFEQQLAPYLLARQEMNLSSRFFRIFGVGESNVETILLDLFHSQNPTLALYCGAGEVTAADREKETVIVLGSGPIRIGQGIEFDYSSVHCVWELKELGYDVVIVNNNPETVSTDFDTADRLYFEPLYPDDVMDIIGQEKPVGGVVAFGGQTAIRLTKRLAAEGVRILGSSADTIDMAEDRERFDALLEKLQIKRPRGHTVMSLDAALEAAQDLGYPVLMRPSYVLGGQNMIIAHDEDDIREYMQVIFRSKQENPVLIDKYLSGKELEIDAICDGEDILIPGIMEHIERTGVHSGDSISVYPAMDIDDDLRDVIIRTTAEICRGLGAIGLVNIQYILHDDDVYVIEVKVPVFSFEKLTDVDTHLGPEMKSTGEVLGIGKGLEEALYKGLAAAGYSMKKGGGVLVTVRDTDKPEAADIAKKFAAMGFMIYATEGTGTALRDAGIETKLTQDIPSLLDSGLIRYVISTSAKGRDPSRDSVRIRRRALTLGIPCFTSLDTADAMAGSLMSRYSERNTELVDLASMRRTRLRLPFVKMQTCGNDYIYFDGRKEEVESPESLSVLITDRHTGVGGDGVVLITKAKTAADAGVRIINFDGSEGLMGGIPLCCAAKYLYDSCTVTKREMSIETASGVKNLFVTTKNGLVSRVSLDMGRAELLPGRIPVQLPGDRVVNRLTAVAGGDYAITCLSVGNPHCVVFCENADAVDVAGLGRSFETDPLFPERVNTEFVQVCEPDHLRMRVWERGNGETLACGTGACAAAAAAVLCGLSPAGVDIRVSMRGGELIVNCAEERILMTAPVRKVFEGFVEI
jgi:carbamoyl-phosphate synthase large subunit